MLGKWSGPVVVVAMLAVACSGNKSLLNERDPFDDPFFSDGLGNGTRSLDEIMREPSPSVGWLARDGALQQKPRSSHASRAGAIDSAPDGENVLLEAEDGALPPEDAVAGADDDEEGALVPAGQKSFYDQASEATMATMSILVGAGMAALPFLIGT